MNQRWKVKLADDPEGREWIFDTKGEAELFVDDRYNLTNHLGYNPDEIYYLIPVK